MTHPYTLIGYLVSKRIHEAEGCYDEESIMALTGCGRIQAEIIRDHLEKHHEDMEQINKELAA